MSEWSNPTSIFISLFYFKFCVSNLQVWTLLRMESPSSQAAKEETPVRPLSSFLLRKLPPKLCRGTETWWDTGERPSLGPASTSMLLDSAVCVTHWLPSVVADTSRCFPAEVKNLKPGGWEVQVFLRAAVRGLPVGLSCRETPHPVRSLRRASFSYCTFCWNQLWKERLKLLQSNCFKSLFSPRFPLLRGICTFFTWL